MRKGISLLEMIIATAIMALIVTTAATTLRSSMGVWDEYDRDSAKLDSAHATVLHLVRQLRQCPSVSAISAPLVTAGNIAAVDADGQTLAWSLAGSDVMFGIDNPTELLSNDINSLQFTGYQADGTATTVPEDIRSVEFVVTVVLDRNVDATKTIRSRVWLRAW